MKDHSTKPTSIFLACSLNAAILIASVFSPVASGVGDAQISELLRLSGLSAQVSQYPALVKEGFLQGAEQGVAFTDAEKAQIIASIDRAFAPEILESKIAEAVKDALSDDDMKSLLSWFQSSTGAMITASEKQASTPAAYEEMMRRAPELAENAELMEYAERLDQLLGATDMVVELQKSTALAIYAAMATQMSPGEPLDLVGYAQQIEAMTPQMRQGLKQLVLISGVYTYEDIDEGSRSKYERFLQTPAASRFNAAAMDALAVGMSEAVGSWAAELPAILESNPIDA